MGKGGNALNTKGKNRSLLLQNSKFPLVLSCFFVIIQVNFTQEACVMKKITVRSLAISYVGFFLGAGFVSGQELWQFFACFGVWGFLGFLLSAGLFLLVDYSALRLAQRTGTADVGVLILPKGSPFSRGCISFLQCLLLFCVLVIMIAGASALLSGMTGLSPTLCGALFVLVVLPAAMLELKGLVAAFSVMVPITAVIAVLLGLVVLMQQDFQLAPPAGSSSVLVPNWWISGITYAAYNLFGSIGVLVPFAALVQDRRTIRGGLGLGTGLLLLLTFSMLATMIARPACGASELPIAELAMQLHPALGFVYQLLMGFGMFSTALAAIFALVTQAGFHLPGVQAHKKWVLPLLLIVAYALSLLGFSDLIGVVYPVFGYVGIPFLAMLVVHFFHTRRSETVGA